MAAIKLRYFLIIDLVQFETHTWRWPPMQGNPICLQPFYDFFRPNKCTQTAKKQKKPIPTFCYSKNFYIKTRQLNEPGIISVFDHLFRDIGASSLQGVLIIIVSNPRRAKLRFSGIVSVECDSAIASDAYLALH